MNYGQDIDLSPVGANKQARYREQSTKPALSLVRKRCACGSVVTAKQLQQYGCCNKCVRSV